MQLTEMLTISEFAELAGVSRSNLQYYDEIDVLKPAYRGENNYRLYSYKQLDLIYVVVSLRNIGLPLKTIRNFMQNRTPDNAQNLFEGQIAVVDREIDKLRQLSDFLKRYVETIRLHKDLPTPMATLELRKSETIYLGPKIDRTNSIFTAYDDFIQQSRLDGINFINHMGQIFAKERVLADNYDMPDHVYVKGEGGIDKIEEGLYATLYERDQQSDDNSLEPNNKAIVGKFLHYVGDNDLDICGDIYVEYPIDEMSASNWEDCLVKIFARVRNR
jgi:Predicted transcriptional regulators